jgi:cation-transporting P-type ATPase 13A2
LRTEAGLSMHMVTGDNAVAAVTVARECALVQPGHRVFLGDTVASAPGGTPHIVWADVDVEEAATSQPSALDGNLLPVDGSAAVPYTLALTGRAWAAIVDQVAAGTYPKSLFHRLIVNCSVFARMSPEAKAALVEALAGTGLYVGMIGDGANDSLALRAAHVGISLSQVEASVSAPFTSAIPDISCIIPVLTEGRGALATSFCLFQFMSLYSTIQFANGGSAGCEGGGEEGASVGLLPSPLTSSRDRPLPDRWVQRCSSCSAPASCPTTSTCTRTCSSCSSWR